MRLRMIWLRIAILLHGGILGLWLFFDGVRALVTGEFVTPKTGPYAGQLGPWAKVVRAVGVDPKSTVMKIAHILIGLGWFVALGGFVARADWGRSAVVICSIASLWYLPVGTLIGGVTLAILITALRR